MTAPTIGSRTDLDTAIQSYLNGNPNTYAPIGKWNVSQVTEMEGLFQGYTDFNEDIGDWVVSQVYDISDMFQGCSSFDQDISKWDVSNVQYMVGTFSGCTAFDQNISIWDVGKVLDMSYMFYKCTAFNQDISSWDTAASRNFENMFDGATAFLTNQNLSVGESPYRYWTINYHPDFPNSYLINDVFGPDYPVDQGFFNQTRPSAQSGGDPYVYPLSGPPVKLPNCSAMYRLYQDERTVVNAEVRAATPEIEAEIVRAAADVGAGLVPISAEAYFFSRLHVAHRDGATWEHVTVDLERRSTSGSTETLEVGAPQLLAQPGQAYDAGASSHVCIPVRWGRGGARRELRVHFSRNPQVRNGLSLRGPGLERGTGLLVRNFRPKLFAIPALESTAAVQIPARCARPLTQRAIRGPTECSLAVQC